MTDEKKDSNLASIPEGGRAAKLDSDQTTAAPPAKPATPKLEKLRLPQGALIAYRKSGGFKFSSREIVIYPDGRVSFGGPDLSKEAYARAARKLNDGQIARLRKTLDQVGFFRTPSAPGSQPPDSIAYEIIARVANRSNYVEVFDGSIPDSLMPLLHQLNALMPKE